MKNMLGENIGGGFFAMDLEVKEEGGIIILRLKGEMDLAMVNSLKEKTHELLALREELRGFILNLSQITFIDSAGIGAILGYFKKVERLGGEFLVTDVSPQVNRLLYLAGLAPLFQVVDHEDEALARLKEEGKIHGAR